ncbi:unnamed protein product [Acidithrix sp. C25]|nr:unnamed protein product [Acidithrix sp. C25]
MDAHSKKYSSIHATIATIIPTPLQKPIALPLVQIGVIAQGGIM